MHVNTTDNHIFRIYKLKENKHFLHSLTNADLKTETDPNIIYILFRGHQKVTNILI